MKSAGSIVLVTLCAGVALAQPAGDKGDAKSLNASGVKLLEAKDYLGALAVFKDAYTRFKSAKILLNIGTTYKLLDRKADAANAYQIFLDSADSDPSKKTEVIDAIAELDRSVAQLAITVTPADSQVRIGADDWYPAATAKLWRVQPGEFKVEARHDGYQSEVKSAHINVGAKAAIVIELVVIPKPEPTIITVPSDSGVHAELVPEGPRSRVGLLALAHIDVTHSGAAAFVGATVDVTAGLQLQAAAILGPTYGGYAGASFAFLTGSFHPTVSAGMPIFSSNGARYALRGAAGIEYELSRHLAVILEVGVEHNLNPEMDINSNVFIPAAGVAGRL